MGHNFLDRRYFGANICLLTNLTIFLWEIWKIGSESAIYNCGSENWRSWSAFTSDPDRSTKNKTYIMEGSKHVHHSGTTLPFRGMFPVQCPHCHRVPSSGDSVRPHGSPVHFPVSTVQSVHLYASLYRLFRLPCTDIKLWELFIHWWIENNISQCKTI